MTLQTQVDPVENVRCSINRYVNLWLTMQQQNFFWYYYTTVWVKRNKN